MVDDLERSATTEVIRIAAPIAGPTLILLLRMLDLANDP